MDQPSDTLDDFLADGYPDVLFLEPRDTLDKCIVGVGRRFHDSFLIYDTDCVIEAFAVDMAADGDLADLTDDDDPLSLAREYFEFNTIGAWVGEGTPAFLELKLAPSGR